MTNAAIIVAAGRGTRAGGPIAKQWQQIGGKTVAAWTVAAFVNHPAISRVVLVVGADSDAALWPMADHPMVQVVFGGDTRGASVLAGLEALDPAMVTNVLIHDVARPAVPHEVIDRVVAALADYPGAAPALAVTDALWRGTDIVDTTESREGLWRAQTPQGFDLQSILSAHRSYDGLPADDVEVARAAGMDVAIVTGAEENMKITGPQDFSRIARYLEPDSLDIRVGNGFDVHRFGPGDHVMLCGVAVPYERGLQGHSDADVGMHTVTDAIYGALAMGDIGTHFPPSDPQWKGAESHIFLRHACELARSQGYIISNADCTLICEFPKVGPHAAAMRDAMADIMGIAPDRISVKATTSEQLGFTGRGEGIACQATVTLVKS